MLDYQQSQSHSSTQDCSHKKAHMDTHNIHDFYPTRSNPQPWITSKNILRPPQPTPFFPSVGLHSLEIGTCDNTINWGCFLFIVFLFQFIPCNKYDNDKQVGWYNVQVHQVLPLVNFFATTPMQPVQHQTFCNHPYAACTASNIFFFIFERYAAY